MSLRLRELPVPVIGLVSALYNDQRAHPHRVPTNYPLRNVMLTAQRFDNSGRSRSNYESLSAFINIWARKWIRCDECAEGMTRGYRHVFAMLNSYFLCDRCGEAWLSEGDSGLPRITGLKHNYKHDERWANDGKDKLAPLAPSGPLFAGLVVPGGSEPITVPFRAGDSALPHVSRILNTLRFELTEGAA